MFLGRKTSKSSRVSQILSGAPETSIIAGSKVRGSKYWVLIEERSGTTGRSRGPMVHTLRGGQDGVKNDERQTWKAVEKRG